MLDIKRIAADPQTVAQQLAKRGVASATVEQLTALQEQVRSLKGQADGLKAERNTLSKQIGEKVRAGPSERPRRSELLDAVRLRRGSLGPVDPGGSSRLPETRRGPCHSARSNAFA